MGTTTFPMVSSADQIFSKKKFIVLSNLEFVSSKMHSLVTRIITDITKKVIRRKIHTKSSNTFFSWISFKPNGK
jgi:bifunctional DNase/RNase